MHRISIDARLAAVAGELSDRNVSNNLGTLYTIPHPAALRAYRKLLSHNPGHLGSFDTPPVPDTTDMLEYEVIRQMADLYHMPKDSVAGYITGGGTEGNLFSFWLGVSMLTSGIAPSALSLLTTPLTHYSVGKAARIGAVPVFSVPLDADQWNMSSVGFTRVIRRLYTKGYRGFLVPLTVGYTVTGTVDDIPGIIRAASTLKRVFPGIRFYFWIDAALNGVTAPFLDSGFAPFDHKEISAVVADFHKFGIAPYPAGLLLYRKPLQRHIAEAVDYLPQMDTTVSGSRTGLPAAAAWSVMHTLGYTGLRTLVRHQMDNKSLFLARTHALGAAIQTITHPDSLAVGLYFPGGSGDRLPLDIEERYWLYGGMCNLMFYPGRKMRVRMYKIFFLPHVKANVVESFARDISRWVRTR